MPRFITNLWSDANAHDAAEYSCSVSRTARSPALPTTPRPARAKPATS
jgi:hypothetical protein